MNTCTFTCVTQPTEQEEKRILRFIKEKHGVSLDHLEAKLDPTLLGGFVLSVDGYTYDYSVLGRLQQLGQAMRANPVTFEEPNALVKELRSEIEGFDPENILRHSAAPGEETEGDHSKTAPYRQEEGIVQEMTDGIVTATGLPRVVYGEQVIFDNGDMGMVMDLRKDTLGIVLLGEGDGIGEGSTVRRTGKTVQVPVGDALLGRTVDALGRPIDEKGPITASAYYPIEREAGGVVTREPVTVPLQTGIMAIDAMVPIGRGQRELIIGDRQTGKTAIAVDAMINQRDTGVICIYVAIGQKASSVARVQETLRKHGVMDNTIIVAAAAGESASMQYIAPYAGAAMGEYFIERGKDVLIVYDDLSKHAVAYRTLSLLLKRSPGREAYPGDVFYLHSRLLERACRLTEEYGGGSMTALPIIETQAGDVSAYIPTNVISITDGQIYLESNLFFAGQRPAINVGLSVSRVGGAAQTKAIKKTSGTLRIDLARFRELEVFTQFSSDLDKATQQTLDHGRRLLELLKQPLYHPLSVSRQAVTLYAGTQGLLDDVALEEVRPFVDKLMDRLEIESGEMLDEIQKTGTLSGDAAQKIRETAEALKHEA